MGWVDAPAHTSLVLEKLGFQIVNTPEEADVVILESNRFDASIFGKKPTLVIGGEAMQNWKNWEFLQDLTLKN